MTIDDLKIPGAKLPNLTGTIKCRVVGWDGPDQMINFNENNRYSFGTTMHNDIQYILAEEFHYSLSSYYMIPTTTIEELAIEQGMISKKKTEKIMKKHVITREQLKSIYDIACNTWKGKITEYANRDPFENTIEFTQAEVNEMFSASDVGQLKVLISILGEPVKEINVNSTTIDFKVDDISVFGTCNMKVNQSFIGLPRENSNIFYLNPDYNWELIGDKLIVTRK